MKRSYRFACYLCLAATMAAGATAYADTFNFQIGGTEFNGSGSLTAVPDASIAGAFEITSISGTFNGMNISGLLPCSAYSPSDPCQVGGVNGVDFDNLLYPAGNPTSYDRPPYVPILLDNWGLGIAVNKDESIQIASASGPDYELYFNGEPGDATPIYVSFTDTQTPEPSSILLFAAGLLGIAASVRHRIKT